MNKRTEIAIVYSEKTLRMINVRYLYERLGGILPKEE